MLNTNKHCSFKFLGVKLRFFFLLNTFVTTCFNSFNIKNSPEGVALKCCIFMRRILWVHLYIRNGCYNINDAISKRNMWILHLMYKYDIFECFLGKSFEYRKCWRSTCRWSYMFRRDKNSRKRSQKLSPFKTKSSVWIKVTKNNTFFKLII